MHSDEGQPNLAGIRSAKCRLRDVVLPLQSALVRAHPDCWVQISPAPRKKDAEYCRKFQHTAVKLNNGTEELVI